MALGHRSKFTYQRLPITEAISLINKVLEVERMVRERRNQELHQFLFELSGGKPESRSIVIDLIDEATNTSAWEDALAGEDAAMLEAVTRACELVGIEVPGQPF